MREYRFDVVRVICMTYLIMFFHVYCYIYPHGETPFYAPACTALAHACLGLFTFVSGYLLGKKYCFGKFGNSDVWTFYKKRILRIIPLFILSSIALWLIDFNSSDATWNGLLCISPFVNPKPQTLYYIPIILWCYLVTPLISRRGLRWRIWGCVSFFILLLVARFLFPTIDNRFVFDALFYFVGVVSASCFDWKLNIPYGTAIKMFVVLAFVLLVAIATKHTLLYTTFRQMAVGAVGVFAILFVSEGISKIGGQKTFYIISYASMACYMFHRFFYWVGEYVWNPSDATIKWIYMAGLVFPVMIVLSYLIQKTYDSMVKRF